MKQTWLALLFLIGSAAYAAGTVKYNGHADDGRECAVTFQVAEGEITALTYEGFLTKQTSRLAPRGTSVKVEAERGRLKIDSDRLRKMGGVLQSGELESSPVDVRLRAGRFRFGPSSLTAVLTGRSNEFQLETSTSNGLIRETNRATCRGLDLLSEAQMAAAR